MLLFVYIFWLFVCLRLFACLRIFVCLFVFYVCLFVSFLILIIWDTRLLLFDISNLQIKKFILPLNLLNGQFCCLFKFGLGSPSARNENNLLSQYPYMDQIVTTRDRKEIILQSDWLLCKIFASVFCFISFVLRLFAPHCRKTWKRIPTFALNRKVLIYQAISFREL